MEPVFVLKPLGSMTQRVEQEDHAEDGGKSKRNEHVICNQQVLRLNKRQNVPPSRVRLRPFSVQNAFAWRPPFSTHFCVLASRANAARHSFVTTEEIDLPGAI